MLNIPIANSFVQITTGDNYGNCDAPNVCLPMENPSDLAFQLVLQTQNSGDANYMMQFFDDGPFWGQVGRDVLGNIGATICMDCNAPSLTNTDLIWKCTGLVSLGSSQYILYFQATGNSTFNTWADLPDGACFNLCFYTLEFMNTVAPPGEASYTTLAASSYLFCSQTCFTKISSNCDQMPTSLLGYANNSDAFGFYYDALGELVDNINFLNTVRLPMYLHSPAYAEDQMTYALSDGSSLKLSHRVWEDYKFKTDYLTRDQHKALVIATAHDLVFIECDYEGIPFNGILGTYIYQSSPTQFVRTEKIEVEWQQENIPRFKLGQAKGVLRLAVSSSNTNSNCL